MPLNLPTLRLKSYESRLYMLLHPVGLHLGKFPVYIFYKILANP
jgi:hypothetical protein